MFSRALTVGGYETRVVLKALQLFSQMTIILVGAVAKLFYAKLKNKRQLFV